MKKKFGGLNTLSGSLAMPEEDSPSLLNVDFDISGSVRKRKGTITIYKDSATVNPVFAARFVTQLGFEFIVSKYDLTLRVLDLVGVSSSVVWSRADVFNSVLTTPYAIALDNNVQLLLCEKQAPVQITFQEERLTVQLETSTLLLNVGVKWVSVFADSVVYVNGIKVTVVKAYSGGVLTLSGRTFLKSDVVYVCAFSWQWWAESLSWFGDNFYQKESRFGASEEDKSLQIPNSIVTDEIKDSINYGVFAFKNDAFKNEYVLKLNNQPQISLEYSFSDGSSYKPDVNIYTSPTKFFVTFGGVTSANERIFTDKDVSANQITVIKHKYSSFDIVNFKNSLGDTPPGITEGSSYFVKKIDDDTIELYSDALLTSIVLLTARNTKSFTDLAIDYTNNLIAITAHSFVNSQAIRFTTTSSLPITLNENTSYYVGASAANSFEVYFDQQLRKKVIFVNRNEIFFNASNVAASVLNLSQHNLFSGDAVRVRTANGTLPATLNITSVYFVQVLTANAVKLYYDAELTTVVPDYTGLSGDVFLYIDGGVHKVIADGLVTTIERVAYNTVSYVRLRQLRFNGNTGLLNQNLAVFVDDTPSVRNVSLVASLNTLSYYTHETEILTPYLGLLTKQKFVSFTAKTPIGVPRESDVVLVNTETQWCGTSAVNTKYNFDNGSYVPVFGFGDYANYETGTFPTFGALYQNRLCIGGVGSEILISGVYDKLVKEAPYRYFQITDDLSNATLDPFKIRIPFPQADAVRVLRQWQQFLFVFTKYNIFKTTLDNNNQFSANSPNLTLVANVGCLSRESVDTTESTMYFLSDSGVFDLATVAQGEYRASEISVPIRSIVSKFTENTRISYDPLNNKLYVYDKRLLVFFTDVKVWSEYKALLPWDITSFMPWRDAMIMCCSLLCDFQMVKTEYNKYIDFAKTLNSGDITVQPCIVKMQSYAGVRDYSLPIPTLPSLEVQDITILLNRERLVYGVDWVKLSDSSFRLTNPTGGELYISYRVLGGYNGAVLYTDNIETSLNGASLGYVSPSNSCSVIPYNGSVGTGIDNPLTGELVQDIGMPLIDLPRTAAALAAEVRAFVSFRVEYSDGSVFSREFTDTAGYNSFVLTGVSNSIESVSYTDGISFVSLSSSDTDSSVKKGSFVVRATLSKNAKVATNTRITVQFETWAKTPLIPLSRISLFVGADRSGLYANTADSTQTFQLFGGNPANRSVLGTVQPNGAYKGLLPSTILVDLGANNLSYTIQSLYSPVDVTPASNILFLGGVRQS